MRNAICLALLMLAAGRAAAADFDQRASMQVKFEPAKAPRGATVTWRVILTIKENYHGYPTVQENPEAADNITEILPPTFGEFVFVGGVKDPPSKVEKIFGIETKVVHGTAVFEGQFIVHPKANPGKYQIHLKGYAPVCDNKNCLNGKFKPEEFEITADEPKPVDPQYEAKVSSFPLVEPKPPESPAAVNGAKAPEATAPATGKREPVPPAPTLEEHAAGLKSVREEMPAFEKLTAKNEGGLLGFLGAAAFWGAVALITPCVFPMIPITVSFFLHQSEKEHHRPITMALIYCGTIIIVLGISAMTLLSIFRELSVHPATNIALGGLFIFFALSLFGMYEITLPSKLTQFTSSREGRGGIVGTVFMALTFTIVSFTCVAPFLGGFAGMAESDKFSRAELFLGAMVFSTTFAAPFFFLALFPSLIKKLPQSGSWLNSVKVVMGFLELAAALKFFRTAELRILPMTSYFTYDLVLGIWVALAVIAGLYLLNIFRLHHDEPIEHIGVVRMLLGLVFLSLGIYLTPALFKQTRSENQRPRGIVYAWVDSFLLPEPSEEDMPWSANLRGTVDAARKELERTGKPQYILLDCTGVTCTNCKINERDVFTRPDVRDLMKQCWLVQHYTDTVPEQFYTFPAKKVRRIDEAGLNLTFQREVFGTEQLPLYVIFQVTKEQVIVKGQYDEGKINDVAAFVRFLKESREEKKK